MAMDELARLKLILSQLIEYQLLRERYEKEFQTLIDMWREQAGLPPIPVNSEVVALRKKLSVIINRMSKLA